MAELPHKLTSSDFDPKSYVHEQTLQSASVDDLLSTRERISKLSEETNGLLKKNVYKNYTQFIDTAKEITYLESEMYQLSHLLSDQQDILNSVLAVSIASGGKSHSSSEKESETDEVSRKNLATLLERVEGCASILESGEKNRSVVHSGEMLELNTQDYRPLRRAYCVLLSDCFMLAKKVEKKRGPVQYAFETVYELDHLAAVNVKDDSNVRNAFKLLVFPDTRIFQLASLAQKTEWIGAFEETKKKRMTKFKRFLMDSRNPFEEDDGLNPFEDDEDSDNHENDSPNWLMELPEDLDVFIAQRQFEEAVDLIHRANEHFVSYPKSDGIQEMRVKIDVRIKLLIEILKNELKVSSERSLYGGPRATRRAVSILLSLGKSSIACDMFLKHQSAVLKQALKQQVMGGSTSPYIEKLCSVFFAGLIEAGHDFNIAFSNRNSCFSAFVMWASSQLQHFIQLYSRHVFTPQVTTSTSAECISHARVHCDRLPEIGLDLSFELNNLLQTYVKRLVTDIKDKMLEVVKLRSNEDKWRPQNHQNVTFLRKFLDDMREIGIEGLEVYVYDECWLSLTSNTTSFGKMYINFLDDLLKLYTASVHTLVNDALVTTFQAQISHVGTAFKNSDNSEKQFVMKNAAFLNESILALSGKHYINKLGLMFPNMAELRTELAKYSGKTVPKYTSTVFV